MNDLVYISRNFTEFGGFATAEIVDFQKRGILCESDFVRAHGSETWLPLTEWLTNAVTETPAPAPKATKPKAPAKKKTAKSGTKKEKAAA